MSMLCGDETAALVGDLGHRNFKFGFAGEDMPKGWIPSAVGEDRAAPASDQPRKTSRVATKRDGRKRVSLMSRPENTEVVWAKKDGKVQDWEAMEALWTHALGHTLNSDITAHPLLVASGTTEDDQDRARMAQLCFEGLKAPALFLARDAMLSAFSLGRATCLVLDVGAHSSVCAPLNDGFVLRKGLEESRIAGDVMDEHIVGMLEGDVLPKLRGAHSPQAIRTAATLKLGPTYENGHGDTSSGEAGDPRKRLVDRYDKRGVSKVLPSYVEWQKLEMVADLKTAVCRVWSELNFHESAASMYATETYELPDGTAVELGPERFRSGELLVSSAFDESFISKAVPDAAEAKTLPELMHDAMLRVPVDLRREMAQQIVLVGGGSLLPGTIERLTKELALKWPSTLKARFLMPSKDQRMFSTFTGGSILATLGSFQQLWISKAEYDEHGESIVAKRCHH